jgi:hypothetical protein
MELEVLLSRQGYEIPDEVRILQAENCHFRDITHARLAEVEYWKKMYANERQANTDRYEELRREYEKRIEDELRRYKKALDDFARAERANADTQRLIEEAFIREIKKLREEHADELRRYITPEEASELRREIERLKRDRENLVIEHEKIITKLKETLRNTLESELLKMAKKHAQQIFDIHMENKRLKKTFLDEIEKYETSDRQKLEGLVSILKKREDEHLATQKGLIDRLNLSHSQFNAILNEKPVNGEIYRQELTRAKKALEEMDNERHEMYLFIRQLVNEGIVDKSIAIRIKREFELRHPEISPVKVKFQELFDTFVPSINRVIGNLGTNSRRPEFTLDLNAGIAETQEVKAGLPSPQFKVSPVFSSPDQIASTFSDPNNLTSNISAYTFKPDRAEAFRTSGTELKARDSIIQDLARFTANF